MNTLVNESKLQQAHREGKKGNCGFNCFGASLFVLGRVAKLYWVDCPEITEFINNNTFQINEVQRGDLLIMYAEDYCDDYTDDQNDEGLIIIHTAVYMGNEEWFHKEGVSRSSFGTQDDVLDSYCYDECEYKRVKRN